MYEKLTAQQKKAFDDVKKSDNIFITGNAGTGKSFLLRAIRQWCDSNELNTVVCAPTGIAAINIDGSTIHRTFAIEPGPILDKATSIPKMLKDTDVLIIDEISMVRIDIFDYIAKIVVALNNYRDREHKNRIKFIVVGDFFQLPPVMTDTEKEILKLKYGDNLGRGFAFQSGYWQVLNFKYIVLTEQLRQSKSDFIDALNKTRVGNKIGIGYFNKKACKQEINNGIYLYGTNKKAGEKNEQEFSKLKTPVKKFKTKYEGTVQESDKVVADVLELREGCRVMILVNDSELRYSNGTFGFVNKIGNNSIGVTLDDGTDVEIERYTWEVKSYSPSVNNKTGKVTANPKVIGTYTQFPLKIAYAITIHKSQGQTYNKVNIDPCAWDCGQLYVALSRAKSIDNLHLTQNIIPRYLVTSPDVINFYQSISER